MLYLDCTKAITFCYKLRESVKKKLDFLKEIYFFFVFGDPYDRR